jgi:hypothetical protein
LSSTLTDGAHYFLDYIGLYGSVLLIPTIVLVGRVLYVFLKSSTKTAYDIVSLVTCCFIGAGLLIPVVEGGDHFYGFRLYQAIYPLLIMPFLLGFSYLKSYKTLLLIVVCFFAMIFYTNDVTWRAFKINNQSTIGANDARMRVLTEYNVAQETMSNASRLNDVFDGAFPSVGFAAAGGMGYVYQGVVYDVLGLNSTPFAHADAIKIGYKGHQSFNKRVLLALEPDIFIPLSVMETMPVDLAQVHAHFIRTDTWDSLVFKNIFNDVDFKKRYVLTAVNNRQHPAYQCYGYFSRSYLMKLRQNKNFKIQTYDV